ncbi:hypothetical protein MNBD_ALPHA05-1689, partial [hydrothermal vent metagenome]
MTKRFAAALLALVPTFAFAAPSERAVELAHRYIIIDGHIDGPSTIANDGADIGAGEKTIDFDY